MRRRNDITRVVYLKDVVPYPSERVGRRINPGKSGNNRYTYPMEECGDVIDLIARAYFANRVIVCILSTESEISTRVTSFLLSDYLTYIPRLKIPTLRN